MLKRLSIVALLVCCTATGGADAFRLGLIRIPKEETAELVVRSVERQHSGEFGSTDSGPKRQAAHAKDLFHA